MLTESWQRNLLAIFIAQTFTMVAFSFVLPFVPLYIESLGVADPTEAAQWAGLVTAATALSMAIVQPIWGNLADRKGRRPMVVRSMLGGAVVLSLIGLVRTPQELLVMRLIQGTVTGTVAAGNALVATSTPRHRLGFAMGVMQVAIFVGNSFGPLGGGLVADHFGFRASFYCASVLLVIGGCIVLLFVKENFTPPPKSAPRQGAWAQSKALLSMTIFSMMLTVTFLIQFGNTIMGPVLSLFISDLSGGSDPATMSGIVLAGTGLVSAASALIIGRLSDRIGPTKILPICLAGAMLTYIPQGMVQTVWELLALRMLLGVFLGGLMPTANALIAHMVSPERRGAAFGLVATSNAIANGTGPLTSALIATFWGFRAVFAAASVLFAFACAWVSFGVLRYQMPKPSPVAAVSEPKSPSAD
jgi:MFS transporter, DHA1 family, multidrug resistance protein